MTSRIDTRLPPLAAILAFEAAARLGSFELAGDELAVTASAIGKRIAALEGRLGAKLLARHPHGVSTTATGLEYLEQVRQALALLFGTPLHRRAARPAQRLRVCAPPTFAREILIPHLADFTRGYPEIELSIATSVPYLGLRPPADVEIVAVPNSTAAGERLLAENLRLVCAPSYAIDIGPLHGPADLARATLLRCPLEHWRPWFAAAGLDWLEPTCGPQFVDMGLVIEAAIAGLGVALVRPSLVRRAVSRGDLVFLFDLAVPANTAYCMVLGTDPAAHSAAQTFADWLRPCCESLR